MGRSNFETGPGLQIATFDRSQTFAAMAREDASKTPQ
jgi:hypothetical protein